MSTLKAAQTGTPTTPFKSTNFTVQSLLLLLFAFLEFVGFPVEVADEIRVFIEATLLAGVGFWGYIRAWIAKGIRFEYTGNVLSYIIAFVGGVVGWFATYATEVEGAVGGLIDVITTGNFNLIFPALFTLGNVIYRIVKDQPWVTPPAPAA